MRTAAGRKLTLAFRVVLAAASTAISRAFSLSLSRSSPPSSSTFQQPSRCLSLKSTKTYLTVRSTTSSAGTQTRGLRRISNNAQVFFHSPRHLALTSAGVVPIGASCVSARSHLRGALASGPSHVRPRRLSTTAAVGVRGEGEGRAMHQDDGLNDSQREAVEAEVGPVRVVAGPGSGKTRVLTRRIAHLVRNVRAPPWSILAVTFTRKASEEMRIRVRDTIGEEQASKIALGTFHSVCARMLRWHGDALPRVVPGLDGRFSIFDTDDSRRLLAEILKDEGVDSAELKPAAIQSAISKLKSEGLGPQDAGVVKAPKGAPKARNQRKIAEIYTKYQGRLIQSNALDFDDIILVALKMLQEDPDVFRAIGRQYRHILVDEWQDTNGPQYDTVLELARAGREAQYAREDALRAAAAALEDEGSVTSPGAQPPPSIFVVGDTDQCIYRFRGADYTNVARFETDFAGCQTVLLRENYRSTENIARAASAVIEKVEARIKQPTVAVQGAGLPIGIMQCSHAAGEASAVANQAEAYWSSGRVSASEIAVMYRTNAQSRSFEEAFLRKALPFVVVGAQRFYERREIKDCLVYLRLAANPCDALAMRRAINTPPRGIGDKTVEALRVLHDSAGKVPELQAITGPECLMALLDPRDLDDLEASLQGSIANSSAQIRFSNDYEGAFGGGSGTWQEEENTRTQEVSATAAGVDVGEGWRGFSVNRARRLGQAFQAGEVQGPTKAQANKLKMFAHVMCRLRVVSATAGLPELLRTVLTETNMQKYVTESLSTTGPVEGAERWRNVLELERAASNPKFSGVAGAGALEAFLTEVALMGGDDVSEERKRREEAEAAGEEGNAGGSTRPPMIQLMTVHASKGLEFDTVFLTGLEEGTFPLDRSSATEELDEERRLMYVGMTRAKSRLFLSWREERLIFTSAGARREESNRSNFLDDIPKDIIRTIDKTTPKEGGYADGSVGYGSNRSGRASANSGGGGRGAGSAQRDPSGQVKVVTRPYGSRHVSTSRSAPARESGGRGTKGRREAHPLDFTTELFKDAGAPRSASARSRSTQRSTVNTSQEPARGSHAYSRGYGGGGGGGGGERSYVARASGLSEEEVQAFRNRRRQVSTDRCPPPVVRDGGVRRSRDADAGIDTSWAIKLADAPEPSFGVCVGAQVSHPVHGPGEVVAIVEGTETVNVRFVSRGEPFVTRVLASKLKARS